MISDWQELTWGDLATLEYGKGLRDYKSNQGSYRVYGTNGAIGWHTEALCKHAGIIIGRKGAYRGVHYSDKPFYVIDTAFYLKPKSNAEIDLKWAYYELLTKDINSMDSGSAIPSTTRESFYQLPVKKPPIEEQRRIAEMLSSLDEKIELNLQMNVTLEKIVQAIFKKWFVDFQFPDFDGELVDGLPKGWRTARLGEVVEVKGGTTPSTKEAKFWDGENFWATPKDLSNLQFPVLLNTERKITNEGVKQIGSGILPKGTLLLSSRAPIGYLAIAQIPVSINQGFIAIQGLSVSNLFMLYWLKMNMDMVKSRANGSTFQEISKGSFREIEIAIPEQKILKLFDETNEPIFERIVSSEIENQTLTQIRDGLLPKLMSGKIRVAE
jgi:type I restriction enzyme S subunit